MSPFQKDPRVPRRSNKINILLRKQGAKVASVQNQNQGSKINQRLKM
jgi:hypothetical protein